MLVVCADDCEIQQVAPLIYLNATEKLFCDGNQNFQFSQPNFLLPVKSPIPLVVLKKSFDLIVPVSSQLDNQSKKQLFTENQMLCLNCAFLSKQTRVRLTHFPLGPSRGSQAFQTHFKTQKMGSSLLLKDIFANPVINMLLLPRIKDLKYLAVYYHSVFKRVTVF